MTMLGRYELVRRIGSGGMAEIWKARIHGPAGFEKVVAVKKVLPQFAQDQQFVEMFVREARLVAKLVHPNIVQVLDFGEAMANEDSDDPSYFIVMEYVAGRDLGSLLRRAKSAEQPLPQEVGLYLTLMAARGLAYAHAMSDSHGKPLGVVHRDVSPSNILVSYAGEVKVTDFGIAKVTNALSRTTIGVLKGKLAYMSPEQRSLKPLDGRSDICCLGLILYELLTNTRLFDGDSNQEIYRKASKFKGLDGEQRARVSAQLVGILDTCLQPNPEDRFQDAIELEEELASVLDARGIIEARSTLSTLMQGTFPEGHRAELADDADSGSELEPATDNVSVILVTDMIREAMLASGTSGEPARQAAPPPAPEPPTKATRANTPPKGVIPARPEKPAQGWTDAGVYIHVPGSDQKKSEKASAPKRATPRPARDRVAEAAARESKAQASDDDEEADKADETSATVDRGAEESLIDWLKRVFKT